MIGAIQQELPNTHHIHCIFHIHQNLPRKLKGILGKDYLKFDSEFYKARNSLSEEMFEVNWNNLKNTYCQAENYLQILFINVKNLGHLVTPLNFLQQVCNPPSV